MLIKINTTKLEIPNTYIVKDIKKLVGSPVNGTEKKTIKFLIPYI